MTEQNLEKRLAEAISHAAPNDLQGVLSRCEMRKGNVIQMTTKRKNPWARNLVAACLALALVGGGGAVYQQTYAVASVVSLDVNPSIELTVNRHEKVLSCEGLNKEAGEVLADMNGGADLKGTKLDVAANAIVGALVRSGYLDSLSSAILISVEDKDQARAARLQQELTSTVDGILKDSSSGASVFSQTVEKNTAIEKQAEENNISTGKAALIHQAMAYNSKLSFDALAELSVEELKDLAETGAPGMPIGKNEAARIALAYAGASDQVKYWEVDAELDDHPAHYEVELYTAVGDFEYDVEAYTGSILSGKADIFSDDRNNIPPAATLPERIGGENALSIARNDFFAKHPDAAAIGEIYDVSVELDEYDDKLLYEVEFNIGRYEVDYDIEAYTGAILDRSVDRDDDWDYDDDRDDDLYDDDDRDDDLYDDDDWDDDLYDDDDRDDDLYDDDDWEDNATSFGTGQATIDSSKAKAAAFAHAGVSENQVTELEVELDEDDGRLEYEVEFTVGNWEYEYTIDAATGAVLEHEKDWDD